MCVLRRPLPHTLLMFWQNSNSLLGFIGFYEQFRGLMCQNKRLLNRGTNLALLQGVKCLDKESACFKYLCVACTCHIPFYYWLATLCALTSCSHSCNIPFQSSKEKERGWVVLAPDIDFTFLSSSDSTICKFQFDFVKGFYETKT